MFFSHTAELTCLAWNPDYGALNNEYHNDGEGIHSAQKSYD